MYFLFFSGGNVIRQAGFGRTAVLALRVLTGVGEPIIDSGRGEVWVLPAGSWPAVDSLQPWRTC